LPTLPETAWISTAPDWVCEILSPSTERYDRGDKRIIYGDAGVGHLWHVDPVLRMLEVFELRGGKWLLLDVYRDNADVAAPPFADVSFPLGLLWPFDPPAEGQA
jgi:Uma2 family endonuclease